MLIIVALLAIYAAYAFCTEYLDRSWIYVSLGALALVVLWDGDGALVVSPNKAWRPQDVLVALSAFASWNVFRHFRRAVATSSLSSEVGN